MSKLYRFFCQHCSWKKITDGTDLQDLKPVKRTKIQRGIPRLDPKTNKIIEPKWKTLPKSFKCPDCGRPVRAVKISDPQKQLESKLEKEQAAKNQEEVKILMIDEMKERYKKRREKEIEQAAKASETRSLARELEEKRLKEELDKIENQKKEHKDANEEKDRPDGSETGA